MGTDCILKQAYSGICLGEQRAVWAVVSQRHLMQSLKKDGVLKEGLQQWSTQEPTAPGTGMDDVRTLSVGQYGDSRSSLRSQSLCPSELD